MNITQIDERVFTLEDSAGCVTNLVLGDKYALVFDTGLGSPELIPTIKSITDLPLLVINSHGHFDHTGGNYLFDKVYLSREDFNLLNIYPKETLRQWYLDMTGEEPEEEFLEQDFSNVYPLDFEFFDLGSLSCQIIPLPGHTKGSVGIYIKDLKLFLSGDALLPVMTLNFYNHLTRKEALESLESLRSLDFEYYLTSHYSKKYSKNVTEYLSTCLKNSYGAKFYDYTYPNPPYTKGYIYVDSLEFDGIGVIISEEEYLGRDLPE